MTAHASIHNIYKQHRIPESGVDNTVQRKIFYVIQNTLIQYIYKISTTCGHFAQFRSQNTN